MSRITILVTGLSALVYILIENQAKELKITTILYKLLEYKRSWIQHVNRMPRNRLPRVMKHHFLTGRRNHGRPLKRLLDTWGRNGSTRGPTAWQVQGETKERELLKCVVAAMYSWQQCGTETLSYRKTRHLVIMDQWNGQQRVFAKKFCWISSIFVEPFKSSPFLLVSHCILCWWWWWWCRLHLITLHFPAQFLYVFRVFSRMYANQPPKQH
jgi:hypothetical protein